MIFLLLAFLQITILIYFYVSFKHAYQLWAQQNVPYISATFPMGNLNFSIMDENFGDVMHKMYRQFRAAGATDYGGLFFLNKPVLLVLSPDFAKTVLVRDFPCFINRGVYFDKDGDPLSANLFFIENNDWKQLRSKMTPTFSSAKIKIMFHGLQTIGGLFKAIGGGRTTRHLH